MTKSQRRSQVFKKGDIVSPFSDLKSSNGWRISNIKRAKIVGVVNNRWNTNHKQELTIKILEGGLISSSYKKITIFSNSVKLISKNNDYEIF